MALANYVVMPTAGPWVAGRRVEHGDVIALTPGEADQELRLGTIVLEGSPLPPDEPALLATDLIYTVRNGIVRWVPVSALIALLTEED